MLPYIVFAPFTREVVWLVHESHSRGREGGWLHHESHTSSYSLQCCSHHFRGVFIKSCKFIFVMDSTSDLFDLVHWRLSFSMFGKSQGQGHHQV